MSRLPFSLAASLSLSVLLTTVFQAAVAADTDAGPLDRPLVLPGDENLEQVTTLAPSVDLQNNPIQSQEQLRTVVEDEQEELEQLPHEQLVDKAEQGERAAQVVLGAEFAREATLLAFAPEAANAALSDAARWYSLAASRGFPGAPSLDQSGIRFFPIRIQREQRP
ncbi:hypothetical protein IMCC3135_31910 [Granulosicoccus antarcticus IMCC3135]|uniref:Uncharacterized protein n=2 Tax=Granulosicoccus TaxID=437504 RepID=A0A2Z2NYM7_9GAMM|nr:hypothetical protein IMCC3135_31910 [Granulosicoccus antarcticus IMCC3135]